MMMEQEDDFGSLFEVVEMEIDEQQGVANQLRSIFLSEGSQFLNIVKSITSSTDQVQKFKKQLTRIPPQASEAYNRTLYQKILKILQQAIGNDEYLKEIISVNFFDFVFMGEKLKLQYSQNIYTNALKVLKQIQNISPFKSVLKFVLKLVKALDKKQKLDQLGLEFQAFINRIKQKKIEEASSFKLEKILIQHLQKSQQQEFFVLVRLIIMDSMNNLHCNSFKTTEEQFTNLFETVYDNPYQQVLQYALKNYKLHSICKQFKHQILSCSIIVNQGKPQYSFTNCKIHKNLLKIRSVFELAIDSADESLFRALRKDLLIIHENQMYFKYTGSMIKKMKNIIKNDNFDSSQESINNFIDLLKLIASNINKKVYFPQMVRNKNQKVEVQEENNPTNYLLSELMYIFCKYFMASERNMEIDMQIVSQKLTITSLTEFLKIGLKWITEEPGSDVYIAYCMNLISFMAHLFIREEYSSMVNYNSDISQLIQKILCGIKHFTYKWKIFKRIKIILERWGETAPPNSPQYAQIIRKFLNAYFDEKSHLKNLNSNVFNPLLVSRGYMSVAGSQASKKILQILRTIIKPQETRERSSQQLERINTYLLRFSFFYTARMKIPATDQVADDLFKLYQIHGQQLSVLQSFRTWILNYSNMAKNNISYSSTQELISQISGDTQLIIKQIRQTPVQRLISGDQIPQKISWYLKKVRIITNNLELKSQAQKYGSLYKDIIFILKQLNDVTANCNKRLIQYILKQKKSVSFLEYVMFLDKKCLYQNLQRTNQNLTNILRFYLCNLHKIVQPNDQVQLLKAVSMLFSSLSKQKNQIQLKDITLINDILGISPMKVQTHLKKQQISRGNMGDENTNQYLMNKEQFIPVNIISVLYQQIHGIFIPAIRNLLQIAQESEQIQNKLQKNIGKQTNKKIKIDDNRPSQPFSLQSIIELTHNKLKFTSEQQIQKIKIKQNKHISNQVRRTIHSLLFPSINIYGPCYFNKKLQDKGKQEHVFGIFLHQLNLVFNEFSSSQIAGLYTEFHVLFDACQIKQTVITSKQVSGNPFRNRPGGILDSSRRMAEISRELSLMGISQQYVQIACQHVPNADPDTIFQWIQNNTQKIVMQQSKREQQSKMRKSVSITHHDLTLGPIDYKSFTQQIKHLTKQLIRKLFKQIYSEKGNKVKEIIFMCLNSFKDEKQRSKKYEQLTEKIFEELDNLNREYSEHKLSIIVGSLQHIVTKKSSIITKMHEKSVTLKLLSFIEKTSQEIGQKILQVINQTLAMPTQKCPSNMIEYMVYICDILMNLEIKSENVSQILYKMTKAHNNMLNQKVLGVVCRGLGKGYIKSQIFSLISIVLEADKDFSKANIEFDIKSFILENVDFKKAGKNDILQVQAKKFAKSFIKFENNPQLDEVCKLLFVKKKNRPNLFFDRTKHQLFSSQILKSPFLSHQLSQTQKIIVCSLVNLIINCQNLNEQIKYIEELYKTLQYYKILIPYCLQLKVGEITFVQWLLMKQFKEGKGNVICFLTFLFVRNGLYLDSNITFSDFLIAKIIKIMGEHKQAREDKWFLLAITYFLHIKNVNKKSIMPFCQQNPFSLKTILEEQLQSNPGVIQRILISESLYLIYQNQLVTSLLAKYKINEHNQFSLEKQFLNMDLFYSYNKSSKRRGQDASQSRYYMEPLARRLGIMRQDRNAIILGVGGSQDEDMMINEDDDLDGGILRQIIMRRMSREQPPSSNPTVFLPRTDIQHNPQQQMQNQGEQGMKQETNLKNEQQNRKMSIEEKQIEHLFLRDIIEKFKGVLQQHKLIYPEYSGKIPIIPKNPITKEDIQNQNYNVSIKQPKTSLDQKFSKTNVFKDRIFDIVSIVDPQNKWAIRGEESKKSPPPDLNSNQNIRQYMLNRLGIDRERRQQGTEQIHMGRIFNILQQYQQPPKEVPFKIIQKKQDEKRQADKIQQKVNEPINEQQQKKVQQIQAKQQEKKPMEQAQKEQKIQLQEPKIQEKAEQQAQKIQVQPKQMQIEQPSEKKQQMEEQIPQNNQQQIMVQEEPPARHRQILSMVGVQQNFLRQCGIDEDLFDSLPQDMQIQQLNMLISTQRVNNNSSNQQGNNQGQSNQNRDPIADLQSQNAAFIASLDPQLRAQTLMEATPQFLLTLPPEMRAEAENHRQRMIGRIIEQEEYQQEQSYNRQNEHKNIVYPNIDKEQFKQIKDKTAREMAKNVLIKFPKFNFQSLKILLQNKKTQAKAVNTLISYAKNINNLNLTEFTYDEKNNQWKSQQFNPSGSIRKTLLEKILNCFFWTINECIYKDESFLTGKNNYQCYCPEQISINEELHADSQGYYPLFELINLSLDNKHLGLTAELMKKVQKQLPRILKHKIIRGMKDDKDKLNDEIYKNLGGLSDDQEMKILFLEQYPESKPLKLQTLAKLLRYNFSRVPYLKKMHSQALQSYKQNPTPQMSQFLSEIFRAYSLEDLKENESILIEHKNSHFQIIKHLYSKGRVLDKQPIGIILQLPHLLDFQTKRFIFQHNPKLNKNRSRLMIEINRRNLFMESYNQIMSHTAKQLQHRIKVQFLDQPAEDAGGVKKQWFLEVSREIFNREYALFQPSQSGNTYQPNPKSYVNPQHLNYFKFIGRFVAKALQQNMLIDAFFTRSFYKMILGQKLELKDLEEQDFNFYKSMIWLKQNELSGDEYTFSYIFDYFGKMTTKELVAGGEKIPVNQENKQEFIQKYSLSIMRDSVNAQIQKFLQGFYEILPKEYISFFEASELELLMSGMPTIDLKDLKENTDYAGYQPNDPQIIWYWEILEEYSSEELAHLIQFITGTSKIPLEGFSQIQGMNGVQKISIHKDCHINQLPRSHTCFNQLDLPAYENKEVMREKMRVAITWGSAGFGFM